MVWFDLRCVLSLLQNDVKTLKKWMADVDVFLNEEWPALGDSEALEKQLEQCTVSEHFILNCLFQWPCLKLGCVTQCILCQTNKSLAFSIQKEFGVFLKCQSDRYSKSFRGLFRVNEKHFG